MNNPAHYLHFGFLLISLANLFVIVLLIVVFLLAVAFQRPEKQCLSTIEVGAYPLMTAEIRERVRRWMPLEDLLPDHLPAKVTQFNLLGSQ